MAQLLTFSTSSFDVTLETPNPFNPIAGQSVLSWIREKLTGTPFTATSPEAEDWGWYMDVSGNGATYLVGASGEPDSTTSDVDWTVQIHKHRTVLEKLTGRNILTDDDALLALLEGFVREESTFRDVQVEKEG